MRRCKFCSRRCAALFCSPDCMERCQWIDEAHAMGERQRLEPPSQCQRLEQVAVIGGVEFPIGELAVLKRRRLA